MLSYETLAANPARTRPDSNFFLIVAALERGLQSGLYPNLPPISEERVREIHH